MPRVHASLLVSVVAAFIATARMGRVPRVDSSLGERDLRGGDAHPVRLEHYEFPRYYRRGPRTLTIARLYEDPFKPRFADRSLDMKNTIESPHDYYRGDVDGTQTPHEAVIKKLVKNGDETTIVFSDGKVSRCLGWRETNRVQNVTPNGDVLYEKQCVRRGLVEIGYPDVVAATVFTSGLAPGMLLTEQLGFPVVARKGNQFVQALGIKL